MASLFGGGSTASTVSPALEALFATGFESDRRLKRDIEPIGREANGLMRYRFRYKKGLQKFSGYMADEVQKLFPHAVTSGADGFMRVVYGLIPGGRFTAET
jgi:hypothetical protein